ncbi:hypothetical protein SEPCBS119000_006713 [Sporothrix epigloea]|uniref:Uncharacterized protein n=1 Tax=Sporothrix epigloea TaxID=1892477 RepID=A0ABP0E4G3_9PEZI
MGFLQIKGPLSATPPPLAGSVQGTVDKLASFFLSKFQESKQESELMTLQCATQLKFEALEKMHEQQTRAMTELRKELQTEMHSELQSFRDKAATLFLEQFSAQLDTIGARRNEKGELALSRLEHRVDDEFRNIGEQLSDLSTKVAVNNAALSAAIEDTGRKMSSGNEVSAESLRHCESEVRSKFSRFEVLLSSYKTEASIESDKISRTLQDANKRLQNKVDSLELTVMRQSEELASQLDKIDRLETQTRSLPRIEMDYKKEQAALRTAITTQNDEISNLAMRIRENCAPICRNPACRFKAMETANATLTDINST